MTEQEAARVIMAWQGWRWLPGMLARLNERRSQWVHEDSRFLGAWLPDLLHAGTWALALSLVEEALGEPVDVAHAYHLRRGEWDCEICSHDNHYSVTSEWHTDHRHARAEALARLVQAMEDA